MRKIISIILCMLSINIPCYATTVNPVYNVSNTTKILINNKEINMLEYQILNYNNRTYLPIRLIANNTNSMISYIEGTPNKIRIITDKKVFMLHDVVDTPEQVTNTLKVTDDKLEEIFKYVNENGIKTGFLGEDANIYFTFDDGYRGNYKLLFPLLKKYNIKATIFAQTQQMYYAKSPTNNHFTYANAKEMIDSGLVQVQPHMREHERCTTLTEEQLITNIEDQLKQFELNGLPKPTKFAYPYGSYDNRTQAIVKRYFDFIVTTNSGNWNPAKGSSEIPRINVSMNFNINTINQ